MMSRINLLVCLRCEQVEKRDVMEAFRLLEVALQQSATDHTTGKFVPSFFPSFHSLHLA